MNPEQLMKSIVMLIIREDNDVKHFGTGFVVRQSDEETYIITCAHVILTQDTQTLRVRDGEQEYEPEIVVQGTPEGADIAVLRIPQNLRKSILTLSRINNHNAAILIAGYEKYDGKSFIERPIRGHIKQNSSISPISGGRKYETIEFEVNASEPKLNQGYSGSPIVKIDDGTVIGIVSRAHGDRSSGLAMSSTTLFDLWSDASFIDIPSRDDNNIISSPTQDQIAQSVNMLLAKIEECVEAEAISKKPNDNNIIHYGRLEITPVLTIGQILAEFQGHLSSNQISQLKANNWEKTISFRPIPNTVSSSKKRQAFRELAQELVEIYLKIFNHLPKNF